MSYRCGFCGAVVPDGRKQLKVVTYRDRVVQTTRIGPRGWHVPVEVVSGQEVKRETLACEDCHYAARHGKPINKVVRATVAPTVDPGEELESFGFDFGNQQE